MPDADRRCAKCGEPATCDVNVNANAASSVLSRFEPRCPKCAPIYGLYTRYCDPQPAMPTADLIAIADTIDQFGARGDGATPAECREIARLIRLYVAPAPAPTSASAVTLSNAPGKYPPYLIGGTGSGYPLDPDTLKPITDKAIIEAAQKQIAEGVYRTLNPTPTPDAAALTAEREAEFRQWPEGSDCSLGMMNLLKGLPDTDEIKAIAKRWGSVDQFMLANRYPDSWINHARADIPNLMAWLGTEWAMHAAWRKRAEEAEDTLRSQAAEIERLRAESDPAVCRLQFPDGSVPGNATEAAEGWKRQYDRLRATLRSQAAEIERLKAETDSMDVIADKEQASHQETILLWKNAVADRDRLRAELAACRAATIEECAKITDDLRESGDNDEDQRMMDHTLGWNEAAESIGERIRALAASPPPPEAAT